MVVETLRPPDPSANSANSAGSPGDAVVAERNTEPVPERSKLLFVELLLLMGDVLAFSCFAQAVAFDRAREDDSGLARVIDRGLVRGVHLHRIVPTQGELLQVFITQVIDHRAQRGMRAPEVFAHVCPGFDGVPLVLPIDDLAHTFDEQSVAVVLDERVPLAAPDHFDHIPAGAAEDGFEFLDDAAVPAHGAVKPLKVAVDDEDQVVEAFTGSERDRAERLGLVGLAVAEKSPHFR